MMPQQGPTNEQVLELLQTHWKMLEALGEPLSRHGPARPRRLVEWGPGTSTFLLEAVARCSNAEEFLSIEHSAPYHELLSSIARGMGGSSFRLEAVPFHEAAFPEQRGSHLFYSTAPLALKAPFDVAFIDGRQRAECLLTAALLAPADGLALMDDHQRVRYTAAREFFDVVDERFGVVALRRKASLQGLHERFLADLQSRPSLPMHTRMPLPPKGLHFNLEPFEEDDFVKLLDRHLPPAPRRVVDWGDYHSLRHFMRRFKAEAGGGTDPGLYLPVRRLVREAECFTDLGYPFVKMVCASLVGTVEPGPDLRELNYATSPCAAGTEWDFLYVGAFRRNECLLAAAAMVSEAGVVALRDPDAPHHAPGRFLYDLVDRVGNFAVLRPKEEVRSLYRGFFDRRPEISVGMPITPAPR